MKPFVLIVDQDGHKEEIKAVAIIAFEEQSAANIVLRIFDSSETPFEERSASQVVLRIFENEEIPESWWRLVVKSMYEGLDKAMAERREKYRVKI